MEKEIIYYYTSDGKCPYKEWRNNLDLSIRLRINKRVEKLQDGLYGDHKPLQKSKLSELRMDFGKGYRIYYYDLETTIVLFIAGSDKKDQKKVIQQANKYFEDYIERNKK
ncbi:MAG: type II toxin-antitoxin system RelE/ParE family toxin [Cyanobacteria bacterium SIG28]|nr:type II toxin-antitoxin system RelE/ParE family toxin [Cyanobacteria bacterium SIG28]